MSPLTRSLLALAALFAFADANCNTKRSGETDPCYNEVDYEPVQFDSRGVYIDVPTTNCPPGMEVVGEVASACNDDPYGPPPNLDMPPYGQWSPIHASCPDEDPDCTGSVKIKQCCN